jgi:hypothetical protein
MTLKDFATQTDLHDKGEVERVALLGYYALRIKSQSAFELSGVGAWLEELFLPQPNVYRLREKLKQSGQFILNGTTVRLHAKTIAALDKRFPKITTSGAVPQAKSGSHTYVDLVRLAELKAISSPNFDLAKLIRMCEELNTAFGNESYFATAMLVRAITDHVPPIFNFKSFSELANNYSGGRSIKESFQRLDLSSRKIADQHLHLQIRRAESLPSKTQVDFSNDLDVLLAEVARTLR